MHITFIPQRRSDTVSVAKSGDVLTIGGKSFDFTSLPDGATIPTGVVPSDWITGPVEREDGNLRLSLILPHGANPSQEVAFPAPLIDPPDGELTFPAGTEEEGAANVDA